MKYTSTRGGLIGVDFEGVLFSGFAPDGGLFMPEDIPKVDKRTLQTWSSYSYIQLVKEICSLFISPESIPRADLEGLIDRAFIRFRHRDIVPITRLKSGLNVMEMWHGVTHAFKDLAMSCVGELLDYFLKRKNKHVTILVATSGDTGSSAIESVRRRENMDIIVLLPHGRCTKIQELQMTTVIEDNVHVFSVDGTSDELDYPIKRLFADSDFVKKHNIMSTNSVNWARILVQIAHFFYGYMQCAPLTELTPVEIIVPTGGAGNITAGCIAQAMGLPIHLVAVVNRNDIVHRTVQYGDFSLGDTKATLASAMDIQEPYNMERILWLLAGSEKSHIKEMMKEFQEKKRVKLPEQLHKKIAGAMTSCVVTDENILGTIGRCWEENHYLLCPHSAVAVYYHYQQMDSNDKSPRCCLAPASAAKFQDVIIKANLTPDIPQEIKDLEKKKTRSHHLTKEDDWEKVLRQTIESISQRKVQ
ncbi:threonine synthase-like 2 [Xenopus laevis]|uniref:Threonine synthase-like 2 n=1 Tax=Xenopus laevis TaxID=8355 RepID=THNS2_XENLA|nr:threonine synthase-like 2 [Xenopus laevis]Q5XH07.1 RecName: Full=Threonine synthase-like 2; Short=TSH2 [Xenopus laevis]AAH84269.1 LOC495098 protein [Xenopus laevis]